MRRRRGRGERKARSAESQVAFFFGPRLPKDIECAKLASRARHSENGRWEHRAVGGGGGRAVQSGRGLSKPEADLICSGSACHARSRLAAAESR